MQLNMLQMQRPGGMGFGTPMMNGSIGYEERAQNINQLVLEWALRQAKNARHPSPAILEQSTSGISFENFSTIPNSMGHVSVGSIVKKVSHKKTVTPYLHGSGTFKIESSHHLARFWGQRKNRSQMNYDKLSRSLRQYYKKGREEGSEQRVNDNFRNHPETGEETTSGVQVLASLQPLGLGPDG